MINQDQRLALAYGPAAMRQPLAALLAFDSQLGQAFRVTSDLRLLNIRLAWWREQLGDPAARDPALVAVNGLIREHPAIRIALERMIDGWLILLDDPPYSQAQLATYASGRGGGLFTAAAMVATCEVGELAGQGWALADLARHCSDRTTADLADHLARQCFDKSPPRSLPATLRSLAILAYFAKKDSSKSIGSKCKDGSPIRMVQIFGFIFSR